MSAKTFDVYKPKRYGNVKVEHKGHKIYVILHATTVVEYDTLDEVAVVRTGGWRTPTTKTAINTALRQFMIGARVFQHKGNWFVNDMDFKEGMVITL